MPRWLRWAGSVVAALVWIVGLAGIPDDLQAWGCFFSSLDNEIARWLMAGVGLGLLVVIQVLSKWRGPSERQPVEQPDDSSAPGVIPAYTPQLSAEELAALNRQLADSRERLNRDRADLRSRLDDSIEAGDALLAKLERTDRPPPGGFDGEVSAWASEARSALNNMASPAVGGTVIDSVSVAASECVRRFDAPPVAYEPHDETGPLKSEMRARLRMLRELRAGLDKS